MANNMSGIYLLASILCLAIGGSVAQFIEGNYNVTAACTTVPPGTQLGSIVSCDYYYVCTKNGPVQTNCPTGYSYDYKAASCSPSSSVSCYYGMDNPCEGKVGDNWVPVIGTCSEWVYCKNDVASGSGTCVNSIFNPDTQSCAYGTCTENPTTGPNLENLCKVIKPSSYFGSTSDCAIYYYCYPDGSMGDGVCPNGAFVAQYGACGYDTNGNCDRITDSPVPNTCTNSGDTTGNDVTCGDYYYCDGSKYVPKSCSSGQYYDTLTEGCTSRQSATPTDGCNRCQYANVQFVNAVDTASCNEYYYCNNGVQGTVSECPIGYFFNEASQGCFPNSGLNIYQANNGACHGAIPATEAPTRIMKVYLMKVLQMSLKDDQQRFIYKTLNFK
ncbi:peritrophin-48 [Drosophila grimshawi]|uniref:peritrophin-48 n=1 Tax=Drosophila grimshawi TaxID=7222 RepID=UPI000C86EEFD|nr:peritrophin-48 [Drosophila grimshawi]